jgi:hypothetical protein
VSFKLFRKTVHSRNRNDLFRYDFELQLNVLIQKWTPEPEYVAYKVNKLPALENGSAYGM